MNDQQTNNESDHTMSKSAKKRAKKQQQQKRASESNDEKNSPTKSDAENTEAVSTPEKVSDSVEPEKQDQVDQLVPLINKFDVNGKALKTIAGHGTVHLGEITPHNILVRIY